MGRGLDQGIEALQVSMRRPEARENLFSGFSENEAQDYVRSALLQSGAGPDDTIILRLTSEEQIEAGTLFVEEAAAMGLGPVRILPLDAAMSDAELEASLADQERQLRGQGVSITLQSFAASSFYGHDDYFDWEEKKSDRRQEAIEKLEGLTLKAERENLRRWTAAMWPTRAWAEEVFPESSDPQKEMARLLSRASFAGDPEGLARHEERLRARASRLSSLMEEGYRAVKISTPRDESVDHPLNRGTELTMELSEGSRIATIHTENSEGKKMTVNNPTDEVYGTPIRSSVSGHFTTTRPYVTVDGGGNTIVIEGIYGEFHEGRLVRISSFDPSFQEIVERDFSYSSDPPTDVLGELGLVDSSGPLAQAKHPDGRPRTFWNNILDENTGVHIGFGKSFTGYTGGTGDVAPAAGAHRDLVIGNENTSVSFVNQAGEEKEVIRSGLWQDD